MNIKTLKEWCLSNKIEERSIKSFWEAFESYRVDDPEEFRMFFTNYNPEYLDVFIDTVSLSLGNWPECNYTRVVTNLRIFYQEKGVGSYRLVFTLSGEIDDDYLTLY
ncbi:hypothetical protein O0555_18050 [Brevibacillus laterosporus]|uniref:Uncharacterized protein n=1 Tax=Brevibacillus laterosporus TaxID=1465 RepID=A0AAP8QEW8_BRELA|nr:MULTISPECIES: hypothetical protein [Brevibacillus]ATO51509.1 hypothetical protein BrL25_21890 [Brevibacillus laterosporus DSM 25]MBG9775992.1 hypothetical protein [Brevibacillus laterosporus]MBG9797558.1 hypothetical protein [Brevibacillus laterosporus]MBG9804865.1 hypothetical protein [Brevibacillus laterosporus]MCR8939231.1 hypothetical protein [Brevibacillus laterosporus]